MSKIIINPELVQNMIEKLQPATLTVSRSSISFNKTASNILSLRKGSCFELEFENDMLFYKDSSKGFEIDQIGEKFVIAHVSSIARIIANILNSNEKKFYFFIGEFKEGRRELIAI